jgi:hypothetical protein
MPTQTINGENYAATYYFSDATFTTYPSTSANPVNSVALPFDGSYLSMARYSDETMQSPRFSDYWTIYDADVLATPYPTNAAKAGALMFFVEAIAEGTRFKPISDNVYRGLANSNGNQYAGYQFTPNHVSLVTNWQAIGNNLQQRLNNPSTTPYPSIPATDNYPGYNFATVASTAAILYFVLYLDIS